MTTFDKALTHIPTFFNTILTGFPFEFSPNQKWILEEFSKPEYSELLLACGRKGGKSDMSAGLALWPIYKLLVMYEDPQAYYNLIPDEPIYVIIVSTSRDQALDVMFQKVRGLVNSSWYLSEYLLNETREELLFAKNLVVRCQSCSSRSGRGYSAIAHVYDELGWFLDRNARMSGEEVFHALQPNLEPFSQDALTMEISSPAGRNGIFWELFKTGQPVSVMQHTPEHGQEPWRAVFQFPTWELNPTKTYEGLWAKVSKDPKRRWRFDMEFGAMFADVIDAAVPREFIDNCIKGEQMPRSAMDKSIPRVIALDPAITGNAYALAMMHKNEDDVVIVDLIKYFLGTTKRPIDISSVEDTVRDLCKRFNVVDVVMDQYQSASTAQRLKDEGIPTQIINLTGKSNMEIYNALLPRIQMGTIQYPEHSRLIRELTFLQRKKRGRGFKIEAANDYTDDGPDVLAMGTYILDTAFSSRFMWHMPGDTKKEEVENGEE